MLRKIRQQLTYANVMSTIACFAFLASGTAYAADTIFSTDIVDGEVKTADIRDLNVTNADLGNLSVGNAKIRADAVDGSKIAANAVGASEVAPESLTSEEIATNAIGATEIADSTIDSGEIINNTLTADDLAAGSAGSAEIATGAVTNPKLGSNSVGSSKVANGSLTAFDIAGGEANGMINLNAGFVADGRCRDFNVSVTGGAEPGDAVLFSVNSELPDGIVLSGVRVSSANLVVGKACNLTGEPFPQLNAIQVAIVTIKI